VSRGCLTDASETAWLLLTFIEYKHPTYDRVRIFGNFVSKGQPAAEYGKASLQMELVVPVRQCNIAWSFSVMRPEYICEELV
jgi:hypothetical protein